MATLKQATHVGRFPSSFLHSDLVPGGLFFPCMMSHNEHTGSGAPGSTGTTCCNTALFISFQHFSTCGSQPPNPPNAFPRFGDASLQTSTEQALLYLFSGLFIHARCHSMNILVLRLLA